MFTTMPRIQGTPRFQGRILIFNVCVCDVSFCYVIVEVGQVLGLDSGIESKCLQFAIFCFLISYCLLGIWYCIYDVQCIGLGLQSFVS